MTIYYVYFILDLCRRVARNLGLLLSKMDSTCHSDVYLIVSCVLARISTACCRPAIPLGAIFSQEEITGVILTAVGTDRQKSWSSSWISHAIFQIILDILEAEKLFPNPKKSESTITNVNGGSNNNRQESSSSASGSSSSNNQREEGVMSNINDASGGSMIVEDMNVDDVDESGINMETSGALIESDSEFEDILSDSYSQISNSTESRSGGSKKMSSLKKLSPGMGLSGISCALDKRLENSGMSMILL